jgi:hypothetical protein
MVVRARGSESLLPWCLRERKKWGRGGNEKRDRIRRRRPAGRGRPAFRPRRPEWMEGKPGLPTAGTRHHAAACTAACATALPPAPAPAREIVRPRGRAVDGRWRRGERLDVPFNAPGGRARAWPSQVGGRGWCAGHAGLATGAPHSPAREWPAFGSGASKRRNAALDYPLSSPTRAGGRRGGGAAAASTRAGCGGSHTLLQGAGSSRVVRACPTRAGRKRSFLHTLLTLLPALARV